MIKEIKSFKDKLVETVMDIYEKTLGRYIQGLFTKPSRILFLGIDNSGKTTLVAKLKHNTNHIHLPTKHMVQESFQIDNLHGTAFDLGGHKAARIAWKDYFYRVDGIVFIVDTADHERFPQVREAYQTVCNLEKSAPILILMNKIDLIGHDKNSIVEDYSKMDQLEAAVGIDKNRKNIEILYLSILSESTYDENGVLRSGFAWLSQKINDRENKAL